MSEQTTHLMTWNLDGSTIQVDRERSGLFATGNDDGFRGVVVADSLDDLYRKVCDAMGLIRAHTRHSQETPT